MAHHAQAHHTDHHADADHGHGHTIIPMRTLVVVLATLLFFTVLTVLAANGEQLFARMFDVHIPGWVNVFVALSIGAVKSIIVAMYFMQLRYDNPVNSVLAVFTIMVLTAFLGFTMIDLGNRKTIYDFKGEAIIPGGYGEVSREKWDESQQKYVTESIPKDVPIAVFARQKADRIIEQSLNEGIAIENHAYLKRLWISYNEWSHDTTLSEPKRALVSRMKAYIDAHPGEFHHIAAADAAHSHGSSHAHGNTGNVSRVRSGITPGLLEGEAKPAGHSAH